MNPDLQTILALIARHGLTSVGLWLAGHGYIDSSGVQGFVGAGILFAGVAWSWWQKRGQALLLAEVQELRSQRVKQAMKQYQGIQMQQAQAAQVMTEAKAATKTP